MFESINIDDQGVDLPSENESEFTENENSVEKEQIARVDIMEQLEEFSDRERELILNDTVAIQLTEGCRGGCPFCSRHLKGEKRNIKAHYSYKSLKKFVEKYQSSLRYVALYDKSDPSDWEDKDENGEYGIVDIYKLFEFPPQITTSIPPGSEQRFIELAVHLAKKNIPILNEIPVPNLDAVEFNLDNKADDYDEVKNGYIRVSEGDHNKQRIKEAKIRLFLELAKSGYSDEEIDLFYNNCIKIEERAEDKLFQIGMLIENHNDIADPANFNDGGDGVVITPGGIISQIASAVTKYEPTGVKSLEIKKILVLR